MRARTYFLSPSPLLSRDITISACDTESLERALSCQGHELHVLMGAEELLTKHGVDLLVGCMF